METTSNIIVPKFYKPWPHQLEAWKIQNDPTINYYFQVWARQTGKDTDAIQRGNNYAWWHPGTQTAYVGLDNVWITNNIFKKYIDGRSFWEDYPAGFLDVKDTTKEVYFLNNPEGMAPARIKYIGFLNDQALIGSSYDRFYISEASLYGSKAFSYVQPIWERKLQADKPLFVNFNGTPRGMHNVLYEMLCSYTGETEPEAFQGRHGNVYVDIKTIYDVTIPDGNGGFKPLADPKLIEIDQERHKRAYGNLNIWNQENLCTFETSNAGLVYLGIEELRKENRYCRFNLDTSKPVYVAFDIASKGSVTDATSGIIYQYINNMMFIYDTYEARGKSLVECLSDLATRPWWQYVRFGALPWDSERSASSETPIEEAKKMFPNINWHSLDKERVDRGIQEVRKQLPNMCINSDNCEYLMECFDNYEYKFLDKADDWAPKPVHNKYSHMMDALRYAVMALREIEYLGLNPDGSWRFQQGEYETTRYQKEPEGNIWGRRETYQDGYGSYST